MAAKTGFIGLGNLGAPIAANILEHRALAVFNRTASKTGPLAAKGAEVCDTIKALAQQCNIVFTMVSDDAALHSLCDGENGLIQNLAAGSIHVSLSTILPQTARDLAARHEQQGQHYIAAPVFGRPEAAVARTLNSAVSGAEAQRKQIEPLLKEAGAAAVWHFGEDAGAANIIKLCGNFLIGSALEAMGESIALAEASGIDAAAMWEMFGKSIFNTPLYHNYSKIVLRKQFDPAAFSAKLGLKDLNLVLQQADSVQATMPLANLLKNNLQQLIRNGGENLDWSALSQAAIAR
jgi:3-hydroxyisobutyrate dehydrogenase-like beta-hydroxyacid dehydrogenase